MQDPYAACRGKSKKGTGFDIDKNYEAKIQAYRDREFGKILKSARRGQAHKAHQPEIQMHKMQESSS